MDLIILEDLNDLEDEIRWTSLSWSSHWLHQVSLRETIKGAGLGAPKSVTLIYLADMGQLE